ncbi:hypothetical protein DSO57_1015064 [Entomophthora muscae]|uniref:Uncharacterized protein n=1 Tax=Entomophthora muscae TaxID=34485 RepID=A0ACC2SI54_9FUNG|nr:hypothetical protein DSO57_1015064 [Entomophthora muscae]
MTTNTKIIYTSIPDGLPVVDKNFQVIKETIDLEKVAVDEGALLVRTLYASVDPYMRFRMRDSSVESYFPAAIPGQPMSGGIIGEVIRSSSPAFKAGDVVTAFGEWAEYSVVQAAGTHIIPDAKSSPSPLSYYLGVAGMPGMTAYAGLHKVCDPIKPGETVFVSAASGAVGQVVGQYAKHLGLRVVGCAGTDEKVEFLTKELGFDAAFNHKTHANDYLAILKQTCPKGIDIYFENVGGKLLDAVLEHANPFCRIPVCGMISQYNKTESTDPIYRLHQLIGKSIRMEGFIVTNLMKQYGKQGKEVLGGLIQQGKMKYREHVVDGIENLPSTFIDMLQGKNFGKASVKIAKL